MCNLICCTFKCKKVQIHAGHNNSLFLKTKEMKQMNEWEVTNTQVCVCVYVFVCGGCCVTWLVVFLSILDQRVRDKRWRTGWEGRFTKMGVYISSSGGRMACLLIGRSGFDPRLLPSAFWSFLGQDYDQKNCSQCIIVLWVGMHCMWRWLVVLSALNGS